MKKTKKTLKQLCKEQGLDYETALLIQCKLEQEFFKASVGKQVKEEK